MLVGVVFFSLLGVGSGFTVGPLRRCSRGPLPLRGAAVDEASLRGFEDLASSRWAIAAMAIEATRARRWGVLVSCARRRCIGRSCRSIFGSR